jgi:D-alanine-D-alanine ligase
MKVAVAYNRDSHSVINLFGVPSREKYGLAAIRRIKDALKAGGHQVITLEGDKDLIDKLEQFMPRVLKGERPGLVFNLSYGIQGQARYTHVPGILEMVGIPYVGSGPLAHSLALDKVVAKMMFRQHDLPTPAFVVLQRQSFKAPDLEFPLIVKPRNEAVSFGLKVVHDQQQLEQAAQVIFETYQQEVLVERYIDGREVNVGLLGNNPPDVLPPAEVEFGSEGPPIYTYEDKTRRSGREIRYLCPAPLDQELTKRAQHLARRAFEVLGCYDCARVDMRLDADGRLYLLEVNSLPSMGARGSYVAAAAAAGLDFTGLVNRLVEVASARYFGTPAPPEIGKKPRNTQQAVFDFLTSRRDQTERSLQDWVGLSSRTSDPYGVRAAADRLQELMSELGMRPARDYSDDKMVWTYETRSGLEGGSLLVGCLDVPLAHEVPIQPFRRDPERLYGEGVGSSRAPLVMLEFALRSLRHQRRLSRMPLGVLYYADEGQDCRLSHDLIRSAAAAARNVLVLRPGNPDHCVIARRRGQRRYRLRVEGSPRRLGQSSKTPDPLLWLTGKTPALSALSDRKQRIAVSLTDIASRAYPMLLPHQVTATLLVTYPDSRAADRIDEQIRALLSADKLKWQLRLVSDRPAMSNRRANQRLLKGLMQVAKTWEIPLKSESSLWPSVAGLVPSKTGAVCGLGPVARELHTLNESVERISLVQRTLLLAEFLVELHGKKTR